MSYNSLRDATAKKPSAPCIIMIDVQSIRRVFAAAGYDEETLFKRLDLSSSRQRGQALAKHLHATRALTPLDVLARLFLLRQAVPIDAVRAAIAPTALDDWVESGLLRVADSQVVAQVEVTPYQGMLAAADWPDADGEPVMSVAASTRAMVQLLIRKHTPRVLDLGTGCGILALMLAGQSDRVIGIDLNPRAVALSTFNARLNGITNVEFREGDRFTPVAGQSFDLIVCNPPFVIGPSGGRMHTQGNQPADHFCRDIVRQAAAFLADGGYCQLVCNWAHLAGEDWLQRLASWFEGLGCDVLILRSHTEDAATYAWNRANERASDAAPLFDEWLAYLDSQRIEAVGFGVITFRRSSEGPYWFRCESLAEMPLPSGAAIERRFVTRDFLRRCQNDADLLNSRLMAPQGLRWEQAHELGEEGWTETESRLRLKDGGTVAIDTDRAVVDFVAQCDGDRTLAEDLQRIAQSSGQDIHQLAPVFLKVVRRLVEAGVLVPAK